MLVNTVPTFETVGNLLSTHPLGSPILPCIFQTGSNWRTDARYDHNAHLVTGVPSQQRPGHTRGRPCCCSATSTTQGHIRSGMTPDSRRVRFLDATAAHLTIVFVSVREGPGNRYRSTDRKHIRLCRRSARLPSSGSNRCCKVHRQIRVQSTASTSLGRGRKR